MSNYDDLLRQKDKNDNIDDSAMEKHWTALEKKMETATAHSPAKYRTIFRTAAGIAAVLLITFLAYTFFKEKEQQPGKVVATTTIKSAIAPPLMGTNVPYETFSFNATTGDTLFTLNGSIIIFPANAVLNGNGEIVTGIIELRTREFNDPFDYSIAGIPMNYDSAGTTYQFISSAMIHISAYQNGEQLKVNPDAKPQLNLVSTNKDRNTNLYRLDSVNGNWMYMGKDEVNLVQANNAVTYPVADSVSTEGSRRDWSTDVEVEKQLPILPVPPQKASDTNPVINVAIDPASFKELLVYDGLKFEVMDANVEKVGEDSKTEWDNIELKRASANGTYKVIFSATNRTAVYNVKPVLEGQDFVAAEKLYQEKLKEYTRIQIERANADKKLVKENRKIEEENKKIEEENKKIEEENKKIEEENKKIEAEDKKIEELNKLVIIRNRFIEAENLRIDALNNKIKKLRDSAIALKKQQQATWEQANRTAALEQNLIRTFQIDGFGYWNCDQPTLPQTQQYVSSFKTIKNEVVTYNTLCIAAAGINRIQNYYGTKTIGLVPGSSYFGWAFNANHFYYFTRKDFKNALVTNNPNTVSISMTLYEGEVKNYNELKGYIFNVNNEDISIK